MVHLFFIHYNVLTTIVIVIKPIMTAHGPLVFGDAVAIGDAAPSE